jgi:hypothetical protein
MAKAKTYDDIIKRAKSCDLEEIRLQNIIHAGITFSGMMRLLKENQKITLYEKLLECMNSLNNTKDVDSFEKMHSEFCKWGTENVWLAEKTNNGTYQKPERLISYGQIAKTLNVVLKVVVHYCQLPDQDRANTIRPWLHAAVDNKMMTMLKSKHNSELNPWPKSIEKVCRDQYFLIQSIVQDFIKQRHGNNTFLAVNYDDIYWNLLNKKGPDQADDE